MSIFNTLIEKFENEKEKPEIEVPAIFTDWVIAVVAEEEELIVLDDNSQWDALEYITGNEALEWLSELGYKTGVYKISFKLWSNVSYEGEYDAGLDVVKEEVIWKLITENQASEGKEGE